MAVPVFSTGEVLTAAAMNAVGLWRITGCTVTSAGGTAATASNGVITIGSGNTSVTVASAFSADYENYRIVISNVVGSANSSVQMQLNNSTGTTYQQFGYYGAFGVATLNAYAPAAAVRWNDVGVVNPTMASIETYLYRPQKTSATTGHTYGVSTGDVYHFALRDTSTNASTGFVLSLAVGSFTSGTIRVYGFRD
jgi:hypothetical protein